MHDFSDYYLLWLGFMAAGIVLFLALVKLYDIFGKMYPYFRETLRDEKEVGGHGNGRV
ncbi:MAG: hypothetical protein ABFC84_13845 [Veillonellales bacterium]